MNLGAGQPAIPLLVDEPLVFGEDVLLLAMNRALENTFAAYRSKMRSIIDNVFEQFRALDNTLSQPVYYQQRLLEQSSTLISDPKTQIEIVHSHLWKARSKHVALKSTAATGGVKKPHSFRLGASTLHKTAKYQKRNFRSSAASLLLEDAISAQSNLNPASVCLVSDSGTRIPNLNFVSTDCVGVDSVLVAKLNGSDVNFENGEDKSSDRKAKVYSGDVKELSVLNGVSVKQDDMQGPNSGENGRECHALHLFDEMSQSDGLCNAGNNIVGYMGIRDKGGGLASHCTFVEYFQLPEKKTATVQLDCKPYVVHNDLGSKQKSASVVAHSEAFTGVHGIFELGDCRLNYFGKGILKAEGNVNGIIGPALIDDDPREQIQVDDYMVQQLERIRNEWGWSKQEFGENTVSAVSLYVRKAGANLTGNKTLILHGPTKYGNSFKLTFSLIISLIELWKYKKVEKNMRWFTDISVTSFGKGCLKYYHDQGIIFNGIKLETLSLFSADKFDKMERDARMMFHDIWRRWKSIIIVGNEYCIEELHEIFPENHMKLGGKCLGYVFCALELVKKLATGANLDDSVCIDKFVLFTATSPNVGTTPAWENKLMPITAANSIQHASGDEEREGPCEFNIDAEQVLVELDKVVVTMKKGEIALVIIFSENAVGAREAQPKWIMIPPNSTLHYAFELVSVIVVKDQKIEVDSKEHVGSNSHTINIMAGVDDRRTFYSACIGVQVHVEDVTTIASICFDLKDGAKIYK